MAVIEFEPTASVEVVKPAWPVASRLEVPRVEELVLNVTVPAGTPPPEVTVAVNVTGSLKTEGLEEELTVVVVAAPEVCTTCTTLPLLAAKIVSEA